MRYLILARDKEYTIYSLLSTPDSPPLANVESYPGFGNVSYLYSKNLLLLFNASEQTNFSFQ